MPSMTKIEAQWDIEHGRCLRCQRIARCEKAHIIDRWCGGIDGVQNIVPLCYQCHAKMPAFDPGDEPMALSWVFTSPPVPEDSFDGDYWCERALKAAAATYYLRLANTRNECEVWFDNWRGDRAYLDTPEGEPQKQM